MIIVRKPKLIDASNDELSVVVGWLVSHLHDLIMTWYTLVNYLLLITYQSPGIHLLIIFYTYHRCIHYLFTPAIYC